MTHPLADMPDRPPGRGPSDTAATGEPSLSMQQRTVLERLITRLVALTSQQNAEVWACVKHDLGLKGDTPLLACHFQRRGGQSQSAFSRRSGQSSSSPDAGAAQRSAGSGQ